ncbi:hypothetical protein IMZ48_28775 [Candidatus Bathyarchaeota archaeon]|nr:hypothetical protein [Candidatus Bathyarchaeota archaeon]
MGRSGSDEEGVERALTTRTSSATRGDSRALATRTPCSWSETCSSSETRNRSWSLEMRLSCVLMAQARL